MSSRELGTISQLLPNHTTTYTNAPHDRSHSSAIILAVLVFREQGEIRAPLPRVSSRSAPFLSTSTYLAILPWS